jgi:hypothetical protein
MLKSKLVFGLIAVVMVLALAQTGFAQMSLTVFGNGNPRDTQTNRTAEVNDPTAGNGIIINAEIIGDAAVSGGRLRFDWPGVVTNGETFPAADGIRFLSPPTGIFTGMTASQILVDNDDGRVEINLPCGGTAASGATGIVFASTGNSTMIIGGVRIDAVGRTAPVTAGVTTVGATGTAGVTAGLGCPSSSAVGTINPVNVILNTTSIESITALSPGIGSVAIGRGTNGDFEDDLPDNNGTGTIFTSGDVADSQASFVVTEGHGRAWYDSAQLSGATVLNDAGVRLVFNGVPDDVTLMISALTSNTDCTADLDPTEVTSDDNEVEVTWSGADCEFSTSTTTLDQLHVNIDDIIVDDADLSAGTNITVTAQMDPIGDALDNDDAVITTDGLPRFEDVTVGPVTVVTIIAASTNLLIPYAVVLPPYDTGLSLANTTMDPFGGSAGGGATPQSGGIRLDFYPRSSSGVGTPFSLTTSSTVRPGVGLSADGTLAAGGTWTALLSELLTAAGQTGGFTGYIFVRTDFLNAHGAPFVSDFRNFTSFSPMLVMPPPAIGGRLDDDTQTESLGF